MEGISIIVCCYNSANRIQPTLEHLFSQDLNSVNCEILLIDNNCSDDTVAIAENLSLKFNNSIPFQIISQVIPGLSYARQKGIEQAKYEYVLFCDDDNWLSPNYVACAYEIMNKDRSIGVLGGRSEAVSDIPLPFWFNTYQGSYAVGVQALYSGEVSHKGYLWGAGMVFRKSLYLSFLELGLYSLLSDRKGDSLSSGGDSEICCWFLLGDYRLWYDEKIYFKHYIPAERVEKTYLEKLQQGFKQSDIILYSYSLVIERKKIKHSYLTLLYKSTFYAIKAILFKANIDKMRAEAYSLLPFPVFSKVVFEIKKKNVRVEKFLNHK